MPVNDDDAFIIAKKQVIVLFLFIQHKRSICKGGISELSSLTDKALAQSKDREYDVSLRALYEEITLWGMAFFEKRCHVKAER